MRSRIWRSAHFFCPNPEGRLFRATHSRVNAGIISAMRYLYLLFSLAAFAVGLTACQVSPTTTSPLVAPSPSPTLPTPTFTPFQPSPTPEPLVARVNGEGLTLAEFQAELGRYQAALGTELATEDQQGVLNDLIDQMLLAQGAAQAGYTPDQKAVQERLERLAAQMGGMPALEAWLKANAYTQEDFRRQLARAMAAAWMRDQIIAAVPQSAEQVHVRQILLYNLKQAEEVLAQLQAGADFATLAAQFDPLTGGDLGWLPRGYFLYPELEQAAFALQPTEYTPVIQTPAGFHILQLVERDPQRPLDASMRQALQRQALQSWLDERRKQSTIQILWP
jgi:parvulin-like peptidyl-prolyl isomerase